MVDPWLFSICFATHARENGAKIWTDWMFDADASTFDNKEFVWMAVRKHHDSVKNDSKPSFLRAKAIVNATGLWADLIQKSTIQKKPTRKASAEWTANPRRGQYRLFRTTNNTQIRHPIQPIPTQRTKGIFVFGTLYDQIAVGPTALDQASRTDRSVDPNVSKELSTLVQKIIPKLDPESACVGSYVGIRPGTDKRDYQIHLSPELNWVAAAGIRSTGLTASLGIGRHVANLLESVLPASRPLPSICTTPLPPVLSLVHQYHQRGDGCVEIHGYTYKVSHPITKFGWEAKTGLADSKESSKLHSKL